ncbi:hypothetical protein AAVH_24227 [Aphelenchoides avenae]|nr:hypothetical protein AAVH_24227 [Aphelenchus avenae]
MSQNDMPPAEAVVPIEQMRIDGIQGLPLAAQPLVPVNKMLQTSVLQLPASFAEHQNYSSAFAPLQTMQGDVEAVALQNPEQTSMSLKICGLFEVCDLFGRDGDNYKDAVHHANDAAKECKLAEYKYKAEVLPQLSKDNKEMQMHRDDLTAGITKELEKDRTASALKWAENNKEMLAISVNHQQNVIVAMSNHVVNLKKLDNDKDNINVEKEKIELEKMKIELEMMKLRNSSEPARRNTHRGGRRRERGRHQPQSQPIVEEVEGSDAIVEEVEDTDR